MTSPSDAPARPDTSVDREWRSRPALARLVRVGLLVIPFLLVVAAAWWVNDQLGRPGSLPESVARWAGLPLMCTVALVAIDRATRRLLPLTALLRLAIVFPERAPARYAVALRAGSSRSLARTVGELQTATAQEAAEHLLSVVGLLTDHDRLTRGHTERVRAYADLIAAEMELDDEERMKLQWAALVHDIGKLTVPADVLNKKSALSDREWDRLRNHPAEGWKLVQPLRPWLGEWARAARDHHERWDGSGYPRGVQGAQISRAGRIVAVADAYDVMTSVRAYKSAMSHEEARAELARCAGTHFDPDVVRAFLSVSVGAPRTSRVGAWLANSPLALQAGSVAQVPAAVTSAVATALAATLVVVPAVLDDHPDEPAAERVVDDATPPTTTDAVRSTTTTTTTTTTTSTTTTTTSPTTVAPTTTTAAPARPTAPAPTAPPVTVAPTTAPPTTTAAAEITAITTTTLPPSRLDGGYLGGPSTGTGFTLVTAVAGSGAPNWDPADNPDPGLTLTSGPSGLAEIDAPHVRTWALGANADITLSGRASLRLHVATPGFDESQGSGVIAGLVDCAGDRSACVTLGQGGALFAQSAFGSDFGTVTVDLGAIDHTVAVGHTLLVTMAVPQSAGTDAWLAFGSSSYPSRLRLD